MIHWIWVGMIVAGSLRLMLGGQPEQVNLVMLEGAKQAVAITIGLCGTMAFWMGILKIAEKSGCIELFTKWFSPLLRIIFPKLAKDHKAFGWIASNAAANLLGMGNAATPLGIRAMQAMQETNTSPEVATTEMRTFVIMNTAGVTLIPVTVIALRHFLGATVPDAIILPSIITTFCALAIALVMDRLFQRRNRA